MIETSSSNRRIAKNSIFLSIRMVIVLLISLYTTRVVLSILGVVDYGVYNVVCGFIAMFAFLNTSMSNGIQRFFNYEYGKSGEDGANKVYCTSLYIQALLALIVVITVELFGLWYLHNKMVIPDDRLIAAEWIFQLAMITFVLGIMQAPFAAAVTAHEKFDFYAVVSVLDAVLKLVIVYLIRTIPADQLVVYGILTTCVALINIFLYYFYCKSKFKEIRFHRGVDKVLFKKMLGFSGWNLFGSFSGVMEGQGINLVLNFFYGPVVNAARGVANQINGGVQSFVHNITMPVRPQVTQSYAKGEIQRMMSLTYGVSKMSCAVVLLLAIPAGLEINYLLSLWLGDNVPNHTASFTILILLASIINNLNAAISGVVHATGVMRRYQLWGGLLRISSVPIAYFLIKYYDIPELGLVAVLFAAAVSHIASLIIARQIVHYSLREYFSLVVKPIVVVFIICLATLMPIHLFLSEGLLRLIVVSFASVVVVGISFYYIAFNTSERKLVLQLFKPMLKLIHKEKSKK